MKHIAAGLAVLAIICATACSPYVFTPEITGFSTGVNSLVGSYETGRKSVSSITEQQRQAANAAARNRLLLLPGCDQADASGTPPKFPDCAVVLTGAASAPAPTPAEQALADAAPAFDALNAYANALAAVTKAADEKTLHMATQSLDKAAGKLAGAVAKLDPAAKGAASGLGLLGGVLDKGISLYLDQRRYEALRKIVPDLDPAVQTLGRTVTAALLDIRAHQLNWLQHEMSAQAEPLEMASVIKLTSNDYQARLAALSATVSAFNVARMADPTKTVDAMLSAHAKLAEALRDGTGAQAALLATIEGFVTSAETLKSATAEAASAKPQVSKARKAAAE